MAIITLGELRTEVLSIVQGTHLSDDEVNVIINRSINRLHRMICNSNSKYYYQSMDFTLNPGDDGYVLDYSISHICGLDFKRTSDISFTMSRFNFAQRNMFGGLTPFLAGNSPLAYDVIGNTIKILPDKRSNTANFRLWYIPDFVPLSEDGYSYAFYQGWEDFVICDAAVQIAATEETDRPDLVARCAVIQEEIHTDAILRNNEQTHTAPDGMYGGGLFWKGY